MLQLPEKVKVVSREGSKAVFEDSCLYNSGLGSSILKNGVKDYIGGNTLMEMGFAHVNDKKVFLLNSVPEKVPYVDEIKAMADFVLNGDLTKII